MSSNNVTQGHLMKIELLVLDVAAVRYPDRAKCAILGVILTGRVFGQSGSFLWSGSHFAVWEPPLGL